jgi:hypothetical protein
VHCPGTLDLPAFTRPGSPRRLLETMMSTFGITTASHYFDQIVLPTSDEFLHDNASSAKALIAIVSAYHLYEWANPKDEYNSTRFLGHYPTRADMVEVFDVAQMLTNGMKHFVPTKPWQKRADTKAETGFSQDFSDDFSRPLSVKTATGQWLSADDLLKRMVAFWRDERTAGRLL